MKLTVQNVSKVYRTRDKNQNAMHALKNVSFSVESGEFCAIVGESGSGKTTLSHIISGLIPATDGKAFFNDDELVSPNSRDRRDVFRKIQLVLQDSKSALDPHLSVYQCIAEPIRNLCRMSRAEEKATVRALLEQMELPEEILRRKPHELSGGQQKRICIARALAVRPDILVFDEAISGLDVLLRKSVLDLLKRIHRETGCTMLFITHDMDVALYMASRIIVMKDGEVVEDVRCSGTPDCLHHPYSRILAEAMLPQVGNHA